MEARPGTRGRLRPGGRTERVGRAVAEAVLDFIQDGVIDFSVQDVAQKSGVARSTVYARWPTREALIAEALAQHSLEFTVEPGPSWRETLRNFAFSFRDFSMQPAEIAINSMVACSKDGFIVQETRRIWAEIARTVSEHLHSARQSGEIRSDIDPLNVIASLMASISGLVVLAKISPSDDFLDDLVAMHLDGCASHAASNTRGA